MFLLVPLVIFVLAVLLDIGSSFFTRLIGVAYPTFKSIQAIETPSTDDDKQWLTYWCIYGFLVVLDEFGGFILSYIPYYFFIKVCILIWLFNPATQGAKTIYNLAVQPILKKYKKEIEEIAKIFAEMTDVSKIKSAVSGAKPEEEEEEKRM